MTSISLPSGKISEALNEALGLCDLATELTGCRGDDDYVDSVREKVTAALAALSVPAPGTGGAEDATSLRLCKRPVEFRVLAHGNWLHFEDEQMAQESADMHCVAYQGLYVRDGSPMTEDATKALREAVTKVENDRTLWTSEWQVWLIDAKAALAACAVPSTPPAGDMGAVKVKPLEWETCQADHEGCEPRTYYGYWVGGYYGIEKRGQVFSVYTFTERGQSRHLGYFKTLKEAKAAAQSDYTSRILSALSPTPVGEMDGWLHPDDTAVDRFAVAMKAKLALKREQGRGGWDGPDCNAQVLSDLLRAHVEKGDPLDVGNLAMMLHQRGERIS